MINQVTLKDRHMPDDSQGSITRWIAELKQGDLGAANGLWERYFTRMVDLARTRLRSSRGRDAGSDEEDAALSAFDSLCAGLARPISSAWRP